MCNCQLRQEDFDRVRYRDIFWNYVDNILNPDIDIYEQILKVHYRVEHANI